MAKQNISILGSTGSIGQSTLEVVQNLENKFKVIGLVAGRNVQLLKEQIQKFRPEIVALEREEDAEALRKFNLSADLEIVSGISGAEDVAAYPCNDIVVSAITGINGLKPTLAAARGGKRIALANKESMVAAGSLIIKTAKESGAQIIPVDSEHSGVFQCLGSERRQDVNKVILTASGGPFFRLSLQEMKFKSPEEALNHPRWKMGRKVTIDSATLMNKGLELIEAKWLFDLQPDQLDVLIHPQSIVHSLVEMTDGSVLAQLSQTDMKIPIQYALTYPEREQGSLPPLGLGQIQTLEFMAVSYDKFPFIRLALQALEEGQYFSIVINAANEVAVEAFLNKEIGFLHIYDVVAEAADLSNKKDINTVDDIFSTDRETREQTRNLLNQRM